MMRVQYLMIFFLLWITGNAFSQNGHLSGRTIVPATEVRSPSNINSASYSMDFESVEKFSLSFSDWKVRDLDSSLTFSIDGARFPHMGDPMAFICFNPDSVSPAMNDPAIRPHGGKKFGACFSAINPPNNDWFISPRVKLLKEGSFSFWVKSYTNAYGYEKYRVAVSTGTNNPADFQYISGSSPLTADTSWTRKSFNLSVYNDQEVYVAVQCVSDTAFIFMIDDLEVNPGDTAEQLPSSAFQDFEQVDNFSLDFTPWTVRDVNGGDTYGIENCYFPNNGSPMAWINFNPSAATPPPLNMAAHTGAKFGASFSSIPPNNPNNKWLISPKLKLENNAKISFWVQTYNLQYGYEKFRIGVSTTGTDPADFVMISGSKPDSAPATWTKKMFDLSQYSGNEVYVGIQCVSDNGFCLMLDDIEISSSVGLEQTGHEGSPAIFPVPAKDRLYLDPGNMTGKEIHIRIDNLTASRSWTFMRNNTGGAAEIDLSDMPEGFYVISVNDGSGFVKKKFIIDR